MVKFKKLVNILKEILPPILLLGLVGFVVFKNFPTNAWITGWDNLHPEFNILVNIKRALFASWQEYQGLGLLGGMGHASDLVREILIYGLMYFVPINLIRSGLIAFTLILGPLGVYFLTRTLLKEKNVLTKTLSSFLAGSFYLLNLGTVLNFWVAFEPYYWFYGFLPWLVFSLLKYLQNGAKRYLLIFFVISLLATPSGYIQTVFIVYSILIFFLIIGFLVEDRFKDVRKKLKLSFFSVLVVLITNAFWFLPVAYFTLTSSQVTLESKANQIATAEVSLSNKNYGSFKDIALLKGYWLSYYDYNSEAKKFDYLVKPWVDHLNTKNVETVGLILFSIVLLGVVYSVFGKIALRWGLLTSFLFGFLMLLGENPPLGSFYKVFEDHIPLLSQIFRSPYTKLVVPMSFLYSVFFGLGAAFLIRFFSKVKGGIFPSLILSVFLVIGLVFFAKPIFDGKLIYPEIKRTIPNEYFQVFDFFKNQTKDGRIGFFPVQTLFGWNFYGWGGRGSGFLWYGIEQPILDRAFDVWSKNDESYFDQINNALYSENLNLFESTLQKYQVRYLLVDQNVIEPGRSQDVLYFSKIKEFAGESSLIKQVANFGKITIYEVSLNTTKNFVFVPKSYTKIDATLDFALEDNIFREVGDYVEDKQGTSYPLANLDPKSGVSFKYDGNNLVIQSGNLNFANKKFLSIPKFVSSKVFPETPDVVINAGRLEVILKTDKEVKETFTNSNGFATAYNCDILKQGIVSKVRLPNGFDYKASNNGISCDFLNYGNLNYNTAYLLRVKGHNLSGRGLRFYFLNWKNQNIERQELLPTGNFDQTYLVEPKNFTGSGYAFNVETRSFGNISSENIVNGVEFIPIPLDWLSQIKLVPGGDSTIQNDLVIKNVTKTGTSNYRVEMQGSGLLALGQGFDNGWVAFPTKTFLGVTVPDLSKKLSHVKIDSWANGWIVNPTDGTSILIIFWPQYLEWGGITLLILGFVAILVLPKKKLK